MESLTNEQQTKGIEPISKTIIQEKIPRDEINIHLHHVHNEMVPGVSSKNYAEWSTLKTYPTKPNITFLKKKQFLWASK